MHVANELVRQAVLLVVHLIEPAERQRHGEPPGGWACCVRTRGPTDATHHVDLLEKVGAAARADLVAVKLARREEGGQPERPRGRAPARASEGEAHVVRDDLLAALQAAGNERLRVSQPRRVTARRPRAGVPGGRSRRCLLACCGPWVGVVLMAEGQGVERELPARRRRAAQPAAAVLRGSCAR